MERTVAIKKLGKILGNKLGYRVNPKAPTRDEREAAKAAWPAVADARNKLKEKWEARRRAILEGDEEYQRLSAELKEVREKADLLQSIQHRHKITVGTSNGMFFTVRAEGDSWEEVIDKLTAQKQAA